MVLDVTLIPPSSIGGSNILLKVEKLTYGIHRNVLIAKFANKDKTKIADVQSSLLDISINGILTSVGDMRTLITATRTWWVAGSVSTSDVTTLAKIQWRDRNAEYMVIDQLSITDMTETDTHEFEYTLELKLDTRKS